jgi:protein-L-isoaspartate O-methyltransferase
MVIPVGRPHLYQELALVTRDENDEVNIKDILGVAFVPLQGERDEG